MKKKWISLALALTLVAAFAVPAMAAGTDDVNAKLQELLAQYPQAAAYVDQAEAWIADNADLVEQQAATILAEIDTAVASAGSAKKLSELSTAQKDAIVKSVTAAANTVGLKVSVNTSKNNFSVTDSTGKVIASYTPPVKQTGLTLDMSGFMMVGVLAVLALSASVAAVVIGGKKRSLNVA